MKNLFLFLIPLLLTGCRLKNEAMTKIIFLHHSTGRSVWVGNTNRYVYKITGQGDVQKYFKKYNKKNKTDYFITEMPFPKSSPYGWKNYPYDYYNIWVKNSGEEPFMEEPTLEILTKDYNVIIFKHCYPVSRMVADIGNPNIDSEIKSLENYKLQYVALKEKMQEFPENKFIVWTPAVNTKANMTEEEAIRAKEFHSWLINDWDETGDNIFLWDFYEYETEGGLYLTEKNAYSPLNSHPSIEFSGKVAPLFSKFIIDVINNNVD